ncbi:hypothetical protein GGR57DRAFT_105723 [Xylariaceae sp. FL1272]|nr:hypothetical protein GGR57DRAFT_105723 [Xylariaceae sp. FL1272]
MFEGIKQPIVMCIIIIHADVSPIYVLPVLPRVLSLLNHSSLNIHIPFHNLHANSTRNLSELRPPKMKCSALVSLAAFALGVAAIPAGDKSEQPEALYISPIKYAKFDAEKRATDKSEQPEALYISPIKYAKFENDKRSTDKSEQPEALYISPIKYAKFDTEKRSTDKSEQPEALYISPIKYAKFDTEKRATDKSEQPEALYISPIKYAKFGENAA